MTRQHLIQRDHARLCDRARAFGVPTSLDDPRSPRTIPALRKAVDAAVREALREGDLVRIGYPHGSWGLAIVIENDPAAKTRSDQTGRLVRRKPLVLSRIEDDRIGYFHYEDVAAKLPQKEA